MKRYLKSKSTKALMAGAAIITLSGLEATRAQAATGTIAMTAEVLTPIAVTSPTNLVFGSMTVGTAGGGTLTVDTGSAVTTTGTVAQVGATTPSAGVLRVSGSTGVAIDLAVPSPTFTVADGTATMAVNGFNLVTAAGGVAQTVTMTSSPTDYSVGGTLNVGAGQLPGTYTGTFTVTASYQ